MVMPVVVANGRVVATWSTRKKRGLIEVPVEPLEPLSRDVLLGLRSEVADLARFRGTEHALKVAE